MSDYDFDLHRREWQKVPIDGVGYFDTAEMLQWEDARLRAVVEGLERTRYDTDGWRNAGNKWRTTLGLDTTHGKHVVDFGCGTGVEALQFAKAGNSVSVVDINESSWRLAHRVLNLWGHECTGALADGRRPYVIGPNARYVADVDVFFASGVVHHFPYAADLLRYVVETLLAPGGEIRLLLYSDKLWTQSTGAALPPVDQPIETHPCFQLFYSSHDPCGRYADWYNRDKLEHRFGDFLNVDEVSYVSSNDAFVVTTMRPK